MKFSKNTGIFVVVISIIICPIIVNWIIESKPIFGIEAVNHNDWIAFFGSFIGGIITLFGVIITIFYTTNQGKEQDRKRVQPYIAINQLYNYSFKNDIEHLNNDDYKTGLISALGESDSLDGDIKLEKLELHGKFKNIGLGTAVSITIKNIKIEKRKFEYEVISQYVLEVGGEYLFRIIFMKIIIKNKDIGDEYIECRKVMNLPQDPVKFYDPHINMLFDIEFEDLLGNRYLQKASTKIQIFEEPDKSINPNVLFQHISQPTLA